MTTGQWERLRAIFQEALDQPPAERAGWLARACEGDEALRREAESLLSAYDTVGDFLEQPAVVSPAELSEPDEPAEQAGPDAGELDDPQSSRWLPGARLGAYEIVEHLGQGGMGVVYLAQDTRLGRFVALKSLPTAIAGRRDLRERLRREARAAATIAHPAVATVYALEEVDGHLVLVSEYVRGPTLRHLIDRGPLDPAHVQAIAVEVARALDAAHAVGVIHRDLKPENVIVSTGGGAKVVDFGIAHLERTPLTRLTREGAAIGTPAYMAPEQLLGGAGDARTDIYAFGVLVLEMLLGRHPMAERPAHGTGPGRPQHPLVAIANRCAQADPAARYGSARELLRDLERGGPAADGRPVPERGGQARWWWEFHQGAATVAYALMLLPAWRAREAIGGLPGRVVFVLTAVAVIVTGLLRLHLWFTSRSYPAELDWVRARAGRWVALADWLFVLSLAASALLLQERSLLDVVLISVAVGAAVAFLLIEPATARAAFGESRRA